MAALQFHHHHHHHHQLRISSIFMTPIFSSDLRPLTTTICPPSIISERFSTSLPKLCATKSDKIKAISRDSADEIKRNWLHSLTSPLSPEETENPTSQWVLGIDPDVNGALAVLKTDDLGFSAQVYDSRIVKEPVGNRTRPSLDTRGMVVLLRSLNIPVGMNNCYIEQSNPLPGNGKQAQHSSGSNYKLWTGALVGTNISVVPVSSLRWKREFKLVGNGSTKDDSIKVARDLFPELKSSLTRKKDHGRVDALLIAEYGRRHKINSDSSSLITPDTIIPTA